MNGTIRDYIKTRVRWCFAVAIAGWLMVALGGGFAKDLPRSIPPFALPLVGFVMFGGSILALQRIAKCPKCKANLGQTIAMPLALSWGSGPKINFCPFCGVRLDEPRPVAPQPVSSQNPIK
jgi:drug/metabolite transporter (DMT)-like permease